MNRFLQRGLALAVVAAACPLVAMAVKPYKPQITAKFAVNSELNGEINLSLTAPTAVSVMSGSGWWATEEAGDPLPEGTVMTLTVTRSCSSLGESRLPVFTQENVTPGQIIELTDTYAENPLQPGYSYTYYCQASIAEGETTETSTEVSSSVKFGLTIDMTDGGEVTENPDGTVTIKYTAPSTYGGETELPVPLTSLELYRLDKYDSKPASGAEPIQTIENPEPGTVVVFTDAEPVVNQENAWYVKALCSLGDGGKKITGWVGYDVPRPVNNLTAVAEGNGMRLTWGAPTSGQNDYYGSNFDPEQTRYKIYRTAGYSQENWTLIAEDLTETEYLDDASDLEEPVQINYSVVAYNNVGEGSGACPDNTYASNSPYIIGPAYTLPFVENVPEDKKSNKLWSIDKPNGGCDWEFKKPFKVGSSWNPTATIEGVEGCGVMGVNYGSGYNRGEVKSTATCYSIDFSNARKPVLRFSYYAAPANDSQFEVSARVGANSELLKTVKISDGLDINEFLANPWTSDWWMPVEIDLSEYAGSADFRIEIAAWYTNTAQAVMISNLSIVDEWQAETFIVDDIEYEVIDEAAEAAAEGDPVASRAVKAIAYHGTATTVTVPWYVENNEEQFDVKEVATGAFAGNETLAEASVETPVIAAGAFEGCPALAKVAMGENTAAIGSRAFADCAALKRVEFAAAEVPAVESDSFEGIDPGCTGKCPDDSYEAYKAHEALKGIKFDLPNSIESVWAAGVSDADVYTIDGVQVLRGADAEAISALAPGVYVVSAEGRTFKIVIR